MRSRSKEKVCKSEAPAGGSGDNLLKKQTLLAVWCFSSYLTVKVLQITPILKEQRNDSMNNFPVVKL